MIKLTDTVKISITVTAFSTLLLMITCILYKLSKLREVMEREPSDAQDGLVTIGLPWRRNSDESISRTSECSVCKHERRNHDSDDACRKDLHHRALQNTAEQDDRVFTGRLIMDIDYKANTRTLLVRNVIGEDLLPWEYSSSDKTYVIFYLKIGEEHDERKGEEVLGLNKACYKQNFEFKLNETDLGRAELSVSVWMSSKIKDSLVGECSVLLGTENMQSTPSGMSVAISRNIMKNVTRKLESEVLLSLSYLPTAERLSVVVMKAKNIEMTTEETITRNQTTVPNPFVKVCLIYGGRKIKKKKTSVKRQEKNPVYNESMNFDVPGNFLHKIGFLITVEHRNFETEQSTVLGRIVMGSPVHNHSLRHWNQMLAFPRRPVAAWHKVFYLG